MEVTVVRTSLLRELRDRSGDSGPGGPPTQPAAAAAAAAAPVPCVLDWDLYAKSDSLYNTPATEMALTSSSSPH